MNRSWAANALGTPPATPSSFSTGYPTDGDPVTNTPPTYPGAWWFHMVTAEILNVITAAGLTPSATTLTQLATAMATIAPVQSVNGATGAVTGLVATSSFTGANQSLSTSGYQKLPGGLILQWGQASVGTDASLAVTLPTTFPTSIFAAFTQNLGGAISGSGVGIAGTRVDLTSTSQITLYNDQASQTMTWFALGK
jgi:hypothetical protein